MSNEFLFLLLSFIVQTKYYEIKYPGAILISDCSNYSDLFIINQLLSNWTISVLFDSKKLAGDNDSNQIPRQETYSIEK